MKTNKSLVSMLLLICVLLSACASQALAQDKPDGTTAQTSPAPGTESQGLPPNGVWQADLTADDFVRMGMMRSAAQSDWTVPFTLMFKDGKYVMDWQVEQGEIGRCEANYQIVGDVLRLTYINSECGGGVDDIQWRIDDEGLHLHLVATHGQFTEVKAFYEAKPWQKFANP
jgi:major membrane immunogen (membrane-anchored lipoprotein)